MNEVLLVQFLVLAFTGIVWWLARRDLGSRPAPPVPAAQADARELEQLCVTLEALVTDLAGRMEAVEQKLQETVGAPLVGPSLAPVPFSVPASALDVSPALASAPPMSSLGASTLLPMPPVPTEEGAASGVLTRPSFLEAMGAEPEIAAHAPLYALLDAGITDPAEITRRTGLGRGEVDLILSLRARRTL